MYEVKQITHPCTSVRIKKRKGVTMYEAKEKLVIKNATFITSAARSEQFITPDKPMIAVCGKSNVGKSSFINMLANRKKLAKTSSEPGRTRLVNYFDFGEFIFADLPGYGFAKVSKVLFRTQHRVWGLIIAGIVAMTGEALADGVEINYICA